MIGNFGLRHSVLKSISVLLISQCLSTQSALAEIVRYKDSEGRVHYVDSADKVPSQFREQLRDMEPLPQIGKVSAAKRDAYLRDARSLPERSARTGAVSLYVTKTCPFCRQAEALLQKNQVRYTKYDVQSDPNARRRHQQLGGGGVPVLTVGSTVIRGYQPAAILSALGIK